MTTEEKAKAYDEALERATALHKECLDGNNPTQARRYEDIFPQLAESEDERIRKALLRCCDDWDKGQFGCMKKEDVASIRAYLEKQKESELLNNGEYHTVKVEILDRLYAHEKELEQLKKEQKPSEQLSGTFTSYDMAKTFTEGQNYVIAHPEKFGLCKPAEWSEEDEPQKELAETYLAVFDEKFPILPTLKGKQLADYKNFLNKCQQILGLKYWSIRPLQAKLFKKLSLLWAAWGAERLKGLGQTDGDTDNEKQEWSEEDEDKVDDICKLIEHATIIPRSGDDDTGIPPTRLNDKYKGELKAFVKSLRNRPTRTDTWKPSEEQIRPLEYAIEYFKKKKNDTTYLESLLNDLNKL